MPSQPSKPTIAPFVIGGLALLAILASIAEIVVAAWALHYFNSLRTQESVVIKGNIAYNTDANNPYLPTENPDLAGTNSAGLIPSKVLFAQNWIMRGTETLAEVTPRVELAAGVIGLVLGLLLCVWTLVKRTYAPQPGSAINIITGIAAVPLMVATTALFGYVFAAYTDAVNNSNLSFSAGGLGWDAWPTWEMWVCAVVDLIDADPGVSAAEPEWRKVCTLTTTARWTLLPVFVFAVLSVLMFLAVWARAGWIAEFGNGFESKEVKNVSEGS